MNRMKKLFPVQCIIHDLYGVLVGANLFVLRMGVLAWLLIIKFDDQVLD
jgi:hypothetical protein